MTQIEDAAARYRAALASREANLTARILRDYHAVESAVRPQLNRILAEIAEIQGRGETVPVSFLFERERLQRLESSVIREMERVSGKTYQQILEEQGHAASLGSRNAMSLTNITAGTSTGIRPLSIRATDRMLANLYDGSPLRNLVAQFPGDSAERIRSTLVQSVTLGRNPRVTGRLMREAFEGNATRALLVARTEQMRAYRGGQLETYQQSDVVTGWTWVAAINSGRTCAVCIALHGQNFPKDEPMASHPACRCVQAPLIDGPQVTITPGEQRFETWGEERQMMMLGPSKFRAYHDGALNLGDLVGTRQSPVWGPSRYERSLVEILGAGASQYYGPVSPMRRAA